MTRSLAHLFFETAGRHPERPALKERGGDGKVWSYAELAEAVKETALGLAALGVERGDRVGLFANSSVRWIVADLAVLALGAADVPRGADALPNEIDYLVRHSGARLVFLQDSRMLEELRPTLAALGETRCVLLEGDERAQDAAPGALCLEEVRERGRERLAAGADLSASLDRTRGEDAATIVYTSGTTGKPKGVVLSHDSVLHNLRAIPALVDLAPDDVFLSILPSWHMFERLIEYGAIACGSLTVYTSKRAFKQDLLRERPTAMAAVPRMYEVLYEEAQKRLVAGGPLRRFLVSLLLKASASYRTSRLLDPGTGRPRCRTAALLGPLHFAGDRLLYARLRAALGGRLRTLISGGGALPLHVDRFFDLVGLPMQSGYGLTETAPLVSVRRRDRPHLGTVGPVIPGTTLEVRDRAGKPLPPGEIGVIHVKGPQVMSGYYRDAEATRRALDADGFFDTGDLGLVWPSGELQITGRAKDTIVLRGGENVEPEPIESALRVSPLIEQVMVVGQDQKQLGALIFPKHEEVLHRLHAAAGAADAARGAEARRLIRGELDRLLRRERGFRPHEQIARFFLLPEPFSSERGEVTETLKLKRHVIAERHAAAIAALFDD